MKTIGLTRGQVTLVDDEDHDFSRHKWNADWNNRTRQFYARRSIKGERNLTISMSREILERKLGRRLTSGEVADHINRDTLDNRRSNLRLATLAQNNRNCRKQLGRSSVFKGVCWHTKDQRWRATISIGEHKKAHLGNFLVEEDAARAYDAAAVERFGEFACLNFPDEHKESAA